MPPLASMQVEQSDVISFHNYGWPEEFEKVDVQSWKNFIDP